MRDGDERQRLTASNVRKTNETHPVAALARSGFERSGAGLQRSASSRCVRSSAGSRPRASTAA